MADIDKITVDGVTYDIVDPTVLQTAPNVTSYYYWRPLLVGASSSSTEGFTPTTKTDQTYMFKTLEVKPSTGTIRCGNLHLYNDTNTTEINVDSNMSADTTLTLPSSSGTLALTSDIPSAELPAIASGDAGKALVVNSGETGVEWATVSGGGGSSIKYGTSSSPGTTVDTLYLEELTGSNAGLYNGFKGIDVNNLLASYSNTANSIVQLSHTATQDCWAFATGSSANYKVQIDGVTVSNDASFIVPLKAGQTITSSANGSQQGAEKNVLKIYGVKS